MPVAYYLSVGMAAKLIDAVDNTAKRNVFNSLVVFLQYLTKYLFPGKKVIYLFPRMTEQDFRELDNKKIHDKEWRLIRNEGNVFVKNIDDIIGVPVKIKNDLNEMKQTPLKGESMKKYKLIVTELENMLKSGKAKLV
jgi:hypothetical protein